MVCFAHAFPGFLTTLGLFHLLYVILGQCWFVDLGRVVHWGAVD
jgi:hypothetical protein